METLRKTFTTLFGRNPAITDDNEELNTQEMLELMQQQQQRQDHDEQNQSDNHHSNNASSSKFNLTTSDTPTDTGSTMSTMSGNAMYIGETGPSVNYHVEFLNFIDRNAPQGFSQKFQSLFPYLALGMVSWPSYWLWRGYQWQTRRRTERIGLYIQRTFQHAKLMQLTILAVGFFMANMARPASSGFEVHEVNYNSSPESAEDDDD